MSFLHEWRGLLKRLPLESLLERKALLQRMVDLWPEERRTRDEAEAIAEMCEEVQDATDFWIRAAMGECPIAHMRPSLEQAMVLNAWHPAARTEGFRNIDESRLSDFRDYEGGYQSIGNFTCNRGGKTFVCCWDTVLWTIPYEEEWKMFEWQEDWLGRGSYRILPRPDWERWRKRGVMRYNQHYGPPKGACTIWHGVSRDDDWTQKLYPAYRTLIPKGDMGIRPDGEEAVYKLEKRLVTKWGHNIIGMSMGAKAITWAGKECFRLNVDEGILRDHLEEGVTRIIGGGYYHQAFTPAEAANIGEMSLVAKKIFKQEPGFELRGKLKCFINFRLEDVPDWIIAPDKKEEDLKRFKGMGERGRPRMEGGFFDTSPVVFTEFRREYHVLPWSTAQIVSAINGKPEPGLECFKDANIVRGFDEGIANPAACVWGALLRTGEVVYFREWEQRGMSIGDQMAKIIDLSGNKREQVNRAKLKPEDDQALYYAKAMGLDKKREERTGTKLVRYREVMEREHVRKTLCDPHIFKKDPTFTMDNWSENYIRAGVRLEKSGSEGPAYRCALLNEMFMRDQTRKHLNPLQVAADEHGCRAYVSKDCVKLIERFENLLQEQRKDGTFTDQPEDKDDHVIDAGCYIVAARMKWVHPEVLRQRRAGLQ